MMVLPFLLFSLSFWLAWKGRKQAAVLFFFLNLALIAFLWNYHMTSPLGLQF